MKEAKTKIYIDARNERLAWDSCKKAEYLITGLETDAVRSKVYEAIGMYVNELLLDQGNPQKLLVTYNPTLITLTYIDYRFRLKGVAYTREGC